MIPPFRWTFVSPIQYVASGIAKSVLLWAILGIEGGSLDSVLIIDINFFQEILVDL